MVQDEFTHDVIVALPGLGLAGVHGHLTGGVRAVSGWRYRPSAQLRSARRPARLGWAATPTEPPDGELCIRHAACRGADRALTPRAQYVGIGTLTLRSMKYSDSSAACP